MPSEEKNYEQSALGKRVNELMDDGYDFGEAVKQAMSEGLKDGGSVGIEILFGPKVPAAPSQLVSESDILLGYRGPGGYQGGSSSKSSSSSTNQGPAGGASAGGNYGGNKNPSQTYGGSVFSGGGGNQNAKPPKTKTSNFVNNLKNVYGIVSPFINPGSNLGKVKTIFDTYNLYKKGPFTEEDMTLGMTPQVPTNMQVAELSQKQLDFLNSPKIQRDLKEFGRDPKAVFDMLPNYEEKPFFGTNQEPTTPQEYNEYLDSIGVPRMTAADGGRVGFFMGGSPLEGEALSIYNSMKAYGNDDQAIADKLQSLGMYTPGDSTPDPTPDQGIINQQLNQGGGDGPKGDFGIFGNLLKDTEKTFTKDVYAIDKNMYPGAPMTGSFKPTEITGYQDVTSGLYKTEDGKNINHLGLNIKPGIISLLEKLGFGDLDETQFTGLPYEEGYVAGTFTGKNPFDFFKKQKATNAEIAAANLKAQQELEAKLAAEKAAMERVREQQAIDEAAYRNQPGQYGGDNRQQEREEAGPGYSGSGTAAEMGSFARGGRVEYKDGGLATMFTRRR